MTAFDYNAGFDELKESYLFTEVREKVRKFLDVNGGSVINLGVGDVAFPLPRSAVRAFVKAAVELGDNVRFMGYPEENGYAFLRKAISERYLKQGLCVGEDEIFIGDGSKTDAASLPSVLGKADVLVCEPAYPVYPDAAAINGNRVYYLKGSKQNGFFPSPADAMPKPYVIWLCSPGNPTGAVITRPLLEEWVRFARQTGSLIIFDAAYASFVEEGEVKSIYEVDGAREVAVELFSFSKYAGFTNLRCSWTVSPREISVKGKRLNELWKRRQSVFFNGVSYPVQRAAEAVISGSGEAECMAIIERYKRNARIIGEALSARGVWYTGGKSSPYIWLECPRGTSSREMFKILLEQARIVGTPGCGFGPSGEGYFRLSCFLKESDASVAAERLYKTL